MIDLIRIDTSRPLDPDAPSVLVQATAAEIDAWRAEFLAVVPPRPVVVESNKDPAWLKYLDFVRQYTGIGTVPEPCEAFVAWVAQTKRERIVSIHTYDARKIFHGQGWAR